MSHEERNTIASLITGILVALWMARRIWARWSAGAFDGPDGLQAWGQVVLWMIPVVIVAHIAAAILFNIGHAVATGESRPSFVRDERDAAINRRGMRAQAVLAGLMLLAGIAVLALGWSPVAALTLIFAGFPLGSIACDAVKLCAYRGGLSGA